MSSPETLGNSSLPGSGRMNCRRRFTFGALGRGTFTRQSFGERQVGPVFVGRESSTSPERLRGPPGEVYARPTDEDRGYLERTVAPIFGAPLAGRVEGTWAGARTGPIDAKACKRSTTHLS
jgi:hypothetical protein